MKTASTTDPLEQIIKLAPTHCEWCGKLKPTTSVKVGHKRYEGIPCRCGCPGETWAWKDIGKPKREKKSDKYRRAGIPARYDDAKINCTEYTEFVMAGSSLYIHGTAGVNGNGKTRFASCVARSLVDAGISVVFANAKEITANRIDKPEDIERMKTCGALVIDDIGKEETGNSGWALGTMYELIDARYSAVKPIIATSNFTRGELADVMEAHGDKSTARAIASRLCEDCIPIEIGGSDMRVSGTR